MKSLRFGIAFTVFWSLLAVLALASESGGYDSMKRSTCDHDHDPPEWCVGQYTFLKIAYKSGSKYTLTSTVGRYGMYLAYGKGELRRTDRGVEEELKSDTRD